MAGQPIGKDICKLSLRDPSGSLFEVDDRLIRVVERDSVPHLNAALNSPACNLFRDQKNFPGTRVVESPEAESVTEGISLEGGVVLEHEKISFRSFSHEWPPEMLFEAGKLTIEIAEKLLPEGLGLKDAHPSNVLFEGTRPVFVDILSVEKRLAGDPTWLPFGQFVRNFLTPLLVNRTFKIPLDMIFLTRRDGLEPTDVYPMLPWWMRFKPTFFNLITLPTWLTRQGNRRFTTKSYREPFMQSPEKARFVLGALLRHLRKTLADVAPRFSRSHWSAYMGNELPYDSEQFKAKESFVKEALASLSPKRVLDIGCNTGHFSRLAAKAGASVVAIDSDATVVGESFRKARHEDLNILSLVVNLNRPSPAVGWKNLESASFLERAKGQFDCLFMLAVVHHMAVGERIPLEDIFKLAAELTTDAVVVEWVGSSDASVLTLSHGKPVDYLISQSRFENAFGRYFTCDKKESISGAERALYRLRKRA